MCGECSSNRYSGCGCGCGVNNRSFGLRTYSGVYNVGINGLCSCSCSSAYHSDAYGFGCYDSDVYDLSTEPLQHHMPVCRPHNKNRIRNDLIGKSYARALRYLTYNGIVHRIQRVDDFNFILTLDFNPNRVNLILTTCEYFNETSNPSEVLSYIRRFARSVKVTDVIFG